jgi:hypothetical protein
MRGRGYISALIAVSAALALSACGSSGEPIPAADATAMSDQLDLIRQQIDAEDCEAALASLETFSEQTNALPKNVDPEVRRGVQQLLGKLDDLVTDRCKQIQAGTTSTTEPTTSDTTTTTTTTPTTTTTDTTTTDTTTTDTTSTTTTDTTSTTTTETGSGGGASPASGSAEK